jgi:ABC-type methionine transport system ATPase subunit
VCPKRRPIPFGFDGSDPFGSPLINQPHILLADEPTGNIDSRTCEEILKEFQRINRERGQTIVMVTHDPAIAAYAPRQVTVRDGLIESDVSSYESTSEREALPDVISLPIMPRSQKSWSSHDERANLMSFLVVRPSGQ